MADIQQGPGVALTGEQTRRSSRPPLKPGEYATTSEIVREAIRDWQFKRLSFARETSNASGNCGMRARPAAGQHRLILAI